MFNEYTQLQAVKLGWYSLILYKIRSNTIENISQKLYHKFHTNDYKHSDNFN